MNIQNIDFQIVTENIANNLDEKIRVLEINVPSWNYVIIFSAVLVLVLFKQFAPKRLEQITSMLYHSLDTVKMMREWNPLTDISGFVIAGAYIALMALFIQKSVMIFNGNVILYGGSDFYLETCIFTSAYILIQYLIINMAGWLFKTQVASQHQAVVHLSMASSMNFIFIMLLLVMTFHPTKFYVILGIIIIMLLTCVRLVKTFIEFQFLIKDKTLKIFLYFCTLEIIPFSVAFTMVFRLVVTGSVL